jgi:alpha-L-rhamnosidase
VTDLLTGAELVTVEVRLGNDWYRGDLGHKGANANYGDEIGFLAELEITFRDGTHQIIATDESWTARVSDRPAHSLYNGQTVDARLRRPDTEAMLVRKVEFDRSTPIDQHGPLIIRHEELGPVSIRTSPSGKTLLDFGQNLVGWIRLRARGEAGDQIVLRHAEVLENGELGTRPLRAAKATDTFILSGDDDVFEPTFTFHGFRCAEISGFPGEVTPLTLKRSWCTPTWLGPDGSSAPIPVSTGSSPGPGRGFDV